MLPLCVQENHWVPAPPQPLTPHNDMSQQLPLDVHFHITPLVTGTPNPDEDFGGVPVPGWAYDVAENHKKIGKFTPTKPIEEHSFEDLTGPMLRFAEMMLAGTNARTTKEMGPSISRNGLPPWLIVTNGGYIELEVQYADGWTTAKTFDVGVTVKYHLEITFS